MGGMMNGYGYMMGSFWPWGGLIGLALNLALIIGVVWLVVWAVQKVSANAPASTHGAGPAGPLSAREILAIRYARGELTREEFQAMRDDISS